jgi:hypothetical protein
MILTHYNSIGKRSVCESRFHFNIFRSQTHFYPCSQMQTRILKLYEWSSGTCKRFKKVISRSYL